MQDGRPAFTSRQANAIQKAVALGIAATVQRVRFGSYRVPSASGTHTYRVTVVGTRYSCECVASQHGQPCHHAAAVLVAKTERASRGRVTGPAGLLAQRGCKWRAVSTLDDGRHYQRRNGCGSGRGEFCEFLDWWAETP